MDPCGELVLHGEPTRASLCGLELLKLPDPRPRSCEFVSLAPSDELH